MKEEAKEKKPGASTHTQHSQAHELCRKAKETLDKANKLLSKSGKSQDFTKLIEGGKNHEDDIINK
jgi:hypothetical protein